MKKQIVKFAVLFFHGAAFVFAVVLYFISPESFSVLEPGGFFSRFSFLHIFLAVWLIDIIIRFFPLRSPFLPGARRQFERFYIKKEETPRDSDIKTAKKQSALMYAVWFMCILFAFILKITGIFGSGELFLLCAFLYFADAFCLYIWCPFRAIIMKNRCCRVCRVRNRDRLMALTPLFFVPGLFSLILIIPAAVLFAVWEITYLRHPERFFPSSNAYLACKNCKGDNCPLKRRR